MSTRFVSYAVVGVVLGGCSVPGGVIEDVQNTLTVLQPDPVVWNSGEDLSATASFIAP